MTAATPRAEHTATGPIAFAGATLARLRVAGRAARQADAAASRRQPHAAPDGRARPIVLGEENKIRQVVTNLIGNALRFTPDDSPIEIGVARRPRTPARRCIAIIDHGEGIPPQIREKIFQRFWRADTSRTRETGGSGLGLAIVVVDRRRAQRHGRGRRDARRRRDLPRRSSARRLRCAPQPVVPDRR